MRLGILYMNFDMAPILKWREKECVMCTRTFHQYNIRLAHLQIFKFLDFFLQKHNANKIWGNSWPSCLQKISDMKKWIDLVDHANQEQKNFKKKPN